MKTKKIRAGSYRVEVEVDAVRVGRAKGGYDLKKVDHFKVEKKDGGLWDLWMVPEHGEMEWWGENRTKKDAKLGIKTAVEEVRE